jgi:hypothetical protein
VEAGDVRRHGECGWGSTVIAQAHEEHAERLRHT